jgi:hypothetical protein
MALAIRHVRWEHSAKRFLLWMALGIAFIAALIAADYFSAIPIP